jgi:photosystem II stability/assembly factor-like uncharacterized protein
MKALLSIALLLQIAGAVCLGQWHSQQSGTVVRLNAVSFRGRLEGFVVGDSGVILHTTNGGDSWVQQRSGTDLRLWDVEITGPSEAWAVGGRSDENRWNADSAIILHTFDGGTSWVPSSPPGPEDGSMYGCFFDCDFTSRLRGAITGRYQDSLPDSYGRPVLLQTTDGGASWSSQSPSSSPTTRYVPSVEFESATDGWLVEVLGSMYYHPRVLKTTDGGLTWNGRGDGGGRLFDINRLHSSGSGLAIAAGWDSGRLNAGTARWSAPANTVGRALITLDGGLTWSDRNLIVGFPSALTGVYCLDSHTAWVAGVRWEEGEPGTYVPRPWILQTTNSGTAWSDWVGASPGGLNGITFADGLAGWAVGDSGTILHTTNGGVTFVEGERTSGIPEGIALLQNYPNPFNPSTTIRYGMPRASDVTLTVHNVLGQEVASLVKERKNAGYHEAVFRADGMASGVYVYVLRAGGSVATSTMILLH